MAEAVQDKKSLYCDVKVLVFPPSPYHICGGVCRGQIHRTLGKKILEMRGRLPLRQKR
jgi:hypothetical protein